MAIYRLVWCRAPLADARFLRRMGRTGDDLPDHPFHQHHPSQDPRARRNFHNGHVELEFVYRGYRLCELAK